MKIAFLIIAHKNPKQVARLCQLLTIDGDNVFLHIDKAADIKPFRAELQDMPDVKILQEVDVCWAGYSQVAATNALIDAAKKTGLEYDYFMLMSGQCFPVQGIGWLKAKLDEGNAGYMNYYPMPRDTYAKTMEKVERYHFEHKGAEPRFARLLRRFLRKLPKRNVVKGLGLWPHAGSQWWCLRADVVDFIVDFRKRRPDFDRYMKTVRSPDEIYYQSMLSASHYYETFAGALFWTMFDPATHHPFVWTLNDFQELIEKNVFVVRKVDETVDPHLIAALEKRYLENYEPPALSALRAVPTGI